jgi:hypothetical protein
MDRRHALVVVAVVSLLIVLAVWVAACGGDGDDPYTGTWTGQDVGTFKIEKANPGWWSIDLGGSRSPFYAAEIDGELQAANGSNTWNRSGDNLEFTAVPGADPVVLTRQ